MVSNAESQRPQRYAENVKFPPLRFSAVSAMKTTTSSICTGTRIFQKVKHTSMMQVPLKFRSLLSMLVLAVFGAAGCREPFEPKGTYQERLVLYSILSNRSDSQYVRVYTSYNPSGHNPLENIVDTDIQNARVTIATDSASFALTSAVIPRDDRSRYPTNIGAYVAHPFPIQFGKTYTLTVTSADGNASASVTTPGPGLVEANNAYVMKNPEKYTDDISAKVRLSSVTQGYILRLYVEFDTKLGSGVVHVRTEVPVAARPGGVAGFEYDYPMLVRRITDRFLVYEIVYFSLDAYKSLLQDLKTKYGEISLTNGTFILTQVESNLYKYFNIANGFQDDFSIRTDLPDYSNVVGGFGVFGAMRDDSVAFDLR